ncbi:hypothetical protein IGI04_030522 [Brassica rapa subsp. trilocularis]|uniref:Uncharacterized protein n=1 Tax=Brassica rapa subsp. trilocularis TaxID=1813537 RepID=A0ABQ7LQY3_BRACM|nr:hypothetical protein IGI04_030522 [Brassica rapa subsp. trilocularis]
MASLGRLIEAAGEIGTQKLGIAKAALISDVRSDGGWDFRRCRDQHMRNLIQAIETHTMEEDCISPDVKLLLTLLLMGLNVSPTQLNLVFKG